MTHPSIRCGVMCAATAALLTTTTTAQWVDLVEEPGRLSASPALGAADTEEKDYAWGDVDGDGDIDLVVVRKQPWTTTGRRVNVLLINENGVLTDRTAQYASASDVVGDQGFLTPTNDRDVVLADVNGDTWLDIVTAVTLTDNEAKHLSHPRVYINLGEEAGVWQGFRYEDDRIPQMHPIAGPRFCAVSAGDVTGDGAPDLFFSDYDEGPPQIFDFNDRLLVNDGNGNFEDQTALRLTPAMSISSFGISNAITDMNGDGFNDIVRLTALVAPYHIGIAYNDPGNEGFFTLYDQIYTLSAYHSAVGDLNGDGALDVIAIDDATDRYLLNQGNDPQGWGHRIKQEEWFAFSDPTHVSLLTMEEWQNLFERSGLHIDRVSTDGLWDVPYVPRIPRFLQMPTFGGLAGVQVLAGRAFLPVHWGECLVLFASKQ